MADNQVAVWDDVAVELTAKVDVGELEWGWISSGVDTVFLARLGVTLGAEGGDHVEGAASLDLFWRQAISTGGHRERRDRNGPGESEDGEKDSLLGHHGDR